jgi:hypothetical protein
MEFPSFVRTVLMKNRTEPQYICNLCDKITPYGHSVGMRRHLLTQTHKEREMQQTALYCATCSLQCKSRSKYDRHINGKRHQERANPVPKQDVVLSCEVCKVHFSCKADQGRHLATAKHTKNVSKAKDLPGALLQSTSATP